MTDSGSVIRRLDGPAACRPRRLKLKVRLRVTPVGRLDDTEPSLSVDDGAAGGSVHADDTSTVELPLLSRIFILLRNPARLVELLLLVSVASCFGRSLSSVTGLLLSDSYHCTPQHVHGRTKQVSQFTSVK